MNKPRLLMIHGLVGSLDYFDPASRISEARVETCDLLGYGSFREVGPARLSLATQAEHLAGFIAKLDPPKAWLLGHSMGGAVGMLLADRWPHLVAGMINVEGNFTLKDAFWSARIVTKQPDDWAREYRAMQSDLAGWLQHCGVEPTETRVAWARAILDLQPPSTVRAMSLAFLAESAPPDFLDALRRVVVGGLPGVFFSPQYTKEHFEGFVRQALSAFPRGRGFVLGVADQVPPDGEFERMCSVRDILENR